MTSKRAALTQRSLPASLLPGFLVVFCALDSGCRAEPQKTAPAAQQGTLQSSANPAAPGAPVPGVSPESTGGFDSSKAYAHVARLVAIGPRTSGSGGIFQAQDYIRGQLRSFGCRVEEDNFHASTPLGSVAMKNILVRVPGASRSIVLFATHYDTKRLPNFVGANDGGSSTALMLELARLLCAGKNKLTVWIAFFDGEEAFVEWSPTDGTYGSRQMAAKLAASGELKRIKAMLLADLIGDGSLRIKRESNSTPWLTDLVWSTAARLGQGKIFVAEETTVEDDHLSFLRRNVPAVDVIDLEEAYWHTPDDTLDKISPNSLGVVGRVFLESLAELEKLLR